MKENLAPAAGVTRHYRLGVADIKKARLKYHPPQTSLVQVLYLST